MGNTGAQLAEKADRAGMIGIFGNMVLTAFKLAAGVLSGSMAVIGDSLHSLSDLLATILVYAGVRQARRPPDAKHPFGHGGIEAIVGLFVAISLALIAFEFGRESLTILLQRHFSQVGALAMVAAAASIVVKEAMARYTFGVANETKSMALNAAAWDHRSDAISSVVVLIGVTAAFMGARILDPLFALGMAFVIGLVGVRIGKQNVENLIGTLPDPDMNREIEAIVSSFPEVKGIHKIRLHYFGPYAEVDMHVIMNPSMTIERSHAVTDRINEQVKARLPQITYVNVHVEPR